MSVFVQFIQNSMVTIFKNKMKFSFSSKNFEQIYKIVVLQLLDEQNNKSKHMQSTGIKSKAISYFVYC